jgi:hypothetical protein
LSKIKISEMAELGVLRNFHYMTGFSSPVVMLEGGAKFAKKSKVGPKDAFAIQSWKKLHI